MRRVVIVALAAIVVLGLTVFLHSSEAVFGLSTLQGDYEISFSGGRR